MSRLAPWLLAPVAGGLWAACFGREPLVLAPWLALAPLFLVLGAARGRRGAFGLGWLHGIAFWLVSIPWIAPTIETFGGLAPWLAIVLLVAVALYLGLFTAVFAALGLPLLRSARREAGAAAAGFALAGLPALWIVLELLRGWLFSGFPWNLAGYAWTEVPGALPLASWVGAWGVGFLAVAANAAVALVVDSLRSRRSWRPAAIALLAALLVLPLAGRYAAPEPLSGSGAALGRPARVVQPAIYNQVAYDPELTRAGYERLFRLSEEACDVPGALVVWPESAAWPLELDRDPLFARDLESFVARTGCPVLLNSTHRVPDPSDPGGELYFNSVYLVEQGGAVARYDKRHLVPFGEYVPLAGVFTFIDRLARSAGDYTAADEVRLLPWGTEALGAAICFEVTFPAEVADLVDAGATVLVTVTNDAWYGDTWAPWQHFRAARWRAAETRRPLLRAAITGVSGVIAPDGSVAASLGVGETGILRTRIAGRHDRSPFVRAPWAVPVASIALALAAVGWNVRITRLLRNPK